MVHNKVLISKLEESEMELLRVHEDLKAIVNFIDDYFNSPMTDDVKNMLNNVINKMNFDKNSY